MATFHKMYVRFERFQSGMQLQIQLEVEIADFSVCNCSNRNRLVELIDELRAIDRLSRWAYPVMF
jgi:hypothetical protein